MAGLHTLTVQELKETLTQAEVAALPRAVLGVAPNGGGDGLTQEQQEQVEAWLSSKLTQAADYAVSAVNACGENARIKLGAGKVPEAVAYHTLVVARHAVISAIPGQSQVLEGSTRAAEYSTAMQVFSRVASCDLFVNDYADSEDPDVVSGGGGIACVNNEAAQDWRW